MRLSPGWFHLLLGSVWVGIVACGDAATKVAVSDQRTASTVDSSDKVPPTPPTGLTGSATAFTISLTWAPSQDTVGTIESYVVYRGDQVLAELGADAASYTDAGLTPLTTYQYQVEAVDRGKNTSGKSDTLSIATTAIGGAELYAQHCAECHGDLALSNRRDRTVTEIQNAIEVIAGMAYLKEKLSSADIEAIAAALSTAVADVTPPPAPRITAIAPAGSTSVVVEWAEVKDDLSGLAGYTLTRNDGQKRDLPADATVFADQNAKPETSYSYQLVAFDTAGNRSPATQSKTIKTPPKPIGVDVTPPSVPQGVVAKIKTSSRIKLTWDRSTDGQGGSGLAGYKVYRNDSLAFDNVIDELASEVKLSAATSYTYVVKAFDAAGNLSAASDAVTVSTLAANGPALYAANCASCHNKLGQTTRPARSVIDILNAIANVPAMGRGDLKLLSHDEIASISKALASFVDTVAPAAPSGLVATAVDDTRISLTWSKANDNVGVYKYRITRNGSFAADVFVTPGNFADATWSFVDRHRQPSTLYSYLITAYDAFGNVSATSNLATATTSAPSVVVDTMPPSIPQTVVASVIEPYRVAITWQPSADDQSGSGVDLYRVYRNGVLIGDAPFGSEVYTDDKVLPSATYVYEVDAIDKRANASAKSLALTVATPVPTGADLYGHICAGCHGEIAESERIGATADDILAALSAQPEMAGITLTEAERRDIATALRDREPPSAVGPEVGIVSSTAIGITWAEATDNVAVAGYHVFLNSDTTAKAQLPATARSYTFSGLNPSTDYTLHVAAVDGAGNISTKGSLNATTSAASNADTISPTKPTVTTSQPLVTIKKVTAPASTQIALQFSGATDNVGVIGYKIQRKLGAAAYAPVAIVGTSDGVVRASSYVDSGLTPATSYKYRVQAIDEAGNVSPFSDEVTQATAPISGAQVYVAKNCDSCHGPLATSERIGRTADDILTAQGKYPQMASIVLSAAQRTALELALVDQQAPSAVTPSVGIAGSTTIGITWPDATDNVAVKGYKLYVNGGATAVASVAADVNAYTFSGLTPSTTYSLQVAAYDAKDNIATRGSVSGTTTAAPVSDTTPPTAPTVTISIPDLTVSGVTAPASDRLVLNWSGATDNDRIVGYKIRRKVGAGTYSDVVIAPDNVVSATTFTDRNLTPETLHYYRVKAVDAAGNESPLSAEVSKATGELSGAQLYVTKNCVQCHGPLATSERVGAKEADIKLALYGPAAGMPPVPGRPVVAMGSIVVTDAEIKALEKALADKTAPTVPSGLVGAPTRTAVNLTWVPSTDNVRVTKYEVHQNDVLKKSITGIGGALPVTSTSVTGLTPDTTYTFKVRAFDGANNASPFSTAITVKTLSAAVQDTEPPREPTTLTIGPVQEVLAGETVDAHDQMLVQWDGATDNIGVVSYDLYRSSGTAATPTIYKRGIKGQSYIDKSLTRLTTYRYAVKAVDAEGLSSPLSVVVAGKTGAVRGDLIYADLCGRCHGALSESAKSGASEYRINLALGRQLDAGGQSRAVPTMADNPNADLKAKFDGLTAVEIAEVAKALRPPRPPEDELTARFHYQQPLLTRLGTRSRLLRAFAGTANPALESTKTIVKLVDQLVTSNAPVFGGACGLMDEDWDCYGTAKYDAKGAPSSSFLSVGTIDRFVAENIDASMAPPTNASRRGLYARACYELGANGVAVANALNAASISASAAVNNTVLTRLYRVFYPGATPATNVLTALTNVHVNAKAKAFTDVEAWGHVVTAVCDAPGGDAL